MITIEFRIYNSHIPSYKQAARELNIDLFVNVIDGEMWHPSKIIVHDYTSFSGLCFIAGTNAISASMTNPLNEMLDTMTRKIDQFKKDNPNVD